MNYNNQNSSTVKDLEARIDKLEMTVEAIWRQLKRHTELTDEDLIETISDIDMEDGSYDGKKQRKGYRDCPKCGRRLKKTATKCVYCGDVFLAQPFD